MSWTEIWQDLDWQAGWAFLHKGGSLMYRKYQNLRGQAARSTFG